MSLEGIRRKNRAWLRRHSYSFFSSLGVLLRHRIGTLMTVMVLGIAMFLPLGLYVTLANLEGMNLRQDEWSAVTVFFKSSVKQQEVIRVAGELEKLFQPDAIVIISPEQGMTEFRDASGFGESLDILEENPLPWVLQVSPRSGETGQMNDRFPAIHRQRRAYPVRLQMVAEAWSHDGTGAGGGNHADHSFWGGCCCGGG